MADLGYTHHAPRAGNRALSTNHTEAGGKRERIPQYLPANPTRYKFRIGQTVTITKPGKHNGLTGTVKGRRTGVPNRYRVYIPLPDVVTPIYPFKESELSTIHSLPSGKPTKAPRVRYDDCIMVFGRVMHTWDTAARLMLIRERAHIARQRAKLAKTDAVIYLPASGEKQGVDAPPAPSSAMVVSAKHDNAKMAAFLQSAMKVQRRRLALAS